MTDAKTHNHSTPPSSHAAAGLAAIVGQLHGLKPFPEAAQRLLSLVCDPAHDANEVVHIIETDLELTAKVLRLINSGAFGLRRVCESIERSIVLLGSRQVSEVAVAQLTMGQFSHSGPAGRIINAHCFAVATMARRLARGRAALAGVDTFTPGILHDLGKLLQLEVDQGEYAALLAQAGGCANQLHELERAHMGYDHAELAAYVMTSWKLPEALVTVVRLHHNQERASAKGAAVAESVAVLRMADHLDYAVVSDPAGGGESVEAAAALDSAEVLKLGRAELRDMWAELAELRDRLT